MRTEIVPMRTNPRWNSPHFQSFSVSRLIQRMNTRRAKETDLENPKLHKKGHARLTAIGFRVSSENVGLPRYMPKVKQACVLH